MNIKKILILILLFYLNIVNAQSVTASRECPSLIDYYSQTYTYWHGLNKILMDVKDTNERKKGISMMDDKYNEDLDKMYGIQLKREWRDATAKTLALNLTELMAKFIYYQARKDVLDGKTTPINSLKREMYSLCIS